MHLEVEAAQEGRWPPQPQFPPGQLSPLAPTLMAEDPGDPVQNGKRKFTQVSILFE